jgi:hypothetical protein
MKRTQIYLNDEQYEYLQNLAFVLSKKNEKKITMSEIIRNAISMLKDNYKKIDNETDIIINSPNILKALDLARKDKTNLDYKDIFGE